ncbi:hypothetical protein E3J62_06940 [candidate division TA06 bacterium]|uniref:Tetratricopeptide repeat protein n=1 Tax=candidate division TA06 bacterium TaxID=2250710 RepID=A0A523USV4_UNCT6|nr:MAG: hypothetical protein E3J62_06940 [candidate division TA06 bacterium]
MIVYGIYGLLFLAGVATLVFLSVGRVAEGGLKMELPHFLLVFAGIWVLLMVLLAPSTVLIMLAVGFIGVVLVPLAIFLMIRNEVIRRTWKRKKEVAEVAKFTRTVKKNPGNVVGHMGLARVFERYDRYLQAAQEYHIAAEMFPGQESGYRDRLAEKEELMRRMFAIEQKKKTNICSQCQARNRPQQRRCSLCGYNLYKNAFEWAWKNTSMGSKISGALVVAISLLYLIWVPLTYSLVLMVMWLAVIVYFSLPVEPFISD